MIHEDRIIPVDVVRICPTSTKTKTKGIIIGLVNGKKMQDSYISSRKNS